MIKEIQSEANPLFKQLKALAFSKKARRQSGTFLMEGWCGIQTLLEHGIGQYRLKQLVISGRRNEGLFPDFIKIIQLPPVLFAKISNVCNTQGVLGVVHYKPEPFNIPESGNLLLLDNLRDPGNLGTLIRSAVGAGFNGILLYGDCVEPFNPKAVRSAVGAFTCCGMWKISDKEVSLCLKNGFDLCVTSGRADQNLYEEQFGAKTILAVGSEVRGVCETLMNRATKRLAIPLRPECESLNAAVAGSICMFQITAGRKKSTYI